MQSIINHAVAGDVDCTNVGTTPGDGVPFADTTCRQGREGDDIVDGTVDINDLWTGSVGSDEIVNNSIQKEDIGEGAVGSNEIVDNSVRSIDIQDGTVAFVDLAPEVVNKINSNMMATQRNREDIDKNTDGIALAMAIANAPVILDGDKTLSLSIGLGFFDDATAGAFKGAVKLAPNAILTGSVAVTDDEVGGGVGVGFGF